MSTPEVSRREFHRLAAAALSGLAAGAASGCGDPAPPGPAGTPPPAGPATDGAGQGAGDVTDPIEGTAGPQNFLLGEKHACRGLNVCRSQDKDGDNACAGQGDCATIAAHSCSGQNECKGQGGCGAAPAQNACKQQGGCSIPLHAGAWEKARAVFESRRKEQGEQFGDAPAAAG